MNNLKPQAAIMAWACPRCKQPLMSIEGLFGCVTCKESYRYADGGIPCLLPSESEDEHKAQKDSVRQMFTAFNQALADNGVSRFSAFINWGYAEARDQAAGNPKGGVNEQSLKLLREIMDGIEVQGKDVLEVACGRGGNIRALCKSYRPRIAAGLDLTEANVAFCHSSNRYENAFFCIGDAEALPVSDECFDLVLNIEASDLYPQINRFYDEVFRVLKPGGLFVYADDLDVNKFDEGIRYLESLGFEAIVKRDISQHVLLASDLSRMNRLVALDGALEDEGAIKWTMGVPGTPLYDDMRTGKRKYQILHLHKKTSS
jgi:SAM-dependent methyltransferase/uncharacterized protein YbaR (Trm112 family)